MHQKHALPSLLARTAKIVIELCDFASLQHSKSSRAQEICRVILTFGRFEPQIEAIYFSFEVSSQCAICETNLQSGVGCQAIASKIGNRFGARSNTSRIVFDRRLEWMSQNVLNEVVAHSHFKLS